MNKLTTKLLNLSAMLLFMAFSASSALAQNYASPNGIDVDPAVAGSCDAFGTPCNLASAVREAMLDGTTANVIAPNSGATVTFQEDLEGSAEITADVEIDAVIAAGSPTNAFVAVDGDIIINGGATLSVAEDVELRLVGQPGRLELHDGASVGGPGFIAFTATGGDHTIFLGATGIDCSTPATPNEGFIWNARVDKTNGDVKVLDECATDDESRLHITNRLNVENGELVMNDNNLFLTGLTDTSGGDDAGVSISGGAVISGAGTVFVLVEEVDMAPSALAKGAAAHGFANTHADCFEIDGDGNMNMAFDKRTNAGVCIDLDEVGAGGFSFNRAGTLFVRQAIQLNGSFLNEGLTGENATSGARTEFWKLKTITTNLEIVGPGDESCDPYDDFLGECDMSSTASDDVNTDSGECETGGGGTGNESGVYMFTGVTVEGDLVMTDTDDPDTEACIEGLWFMGDDDPDDSALAKGAGPSDHQPFSSMEGDFTNKGTSGVYLDDDDFVHNVAFQGDFIFDIGGGAVPFFTLVAPADASTRGDLCEDYTNEADGNKVLFTGSDDQELRYSSSDILDIKSVQINKDRTGRDVEIDEDSGEFLIGNSLEVIQGTFITNGLLDANDEGDAGHLEGNTVVINRDDDGDGVLQAGAAERAYTSDDADDTPDKVKYTGNIRHFSGDEIPGDRDGSVEGAEIHMPNLEIFSSNDDAVITLGKDFTIGPVGNVGGKLIITQGTLDVGSSIIRLANTLRIEIGDGNISEPNQIGERGAFDFPTEWIPLDAPDGFDRSFNVGEDGIDLLYFGTTGRTVGLEWPPSDTDVERRYEDADVIRDVTINPACEDDHIVIDLREDDNESRINGDVIIGSEPFLDSGERADDGSPDDGHDNDDGEGSGELDINGDILEINATHGEDLANNDTVVEVHAGSKLTDSTDELLANMARTAEFVEGYRNALAEYRRTRTAEAAEAMQVQIDLLKAAQQGISKTADHAGLTRYIGADRTDVWVDTECCGDDLRFDFPAIEVDKSGLGSDDSSGSDPRVTFNANGILSTTTGGVDANNPDVIGTSHFTLTTAATGDDDCRTDRTDSGCGDGGGVELLSNLDIFDVGGNYYQYDGEFLMNGISSIGPTPVKPYVQTVIVGERFSPGNMVIEDGEFYAGDNDSDAPGANAGTGGNVEVFGDFCLGCTPPASNDAAAKLASHIDPSSGVFSLAQHGTQVVVGDFSVGPDTDPTDGAELDTDARNRYYLGGECGTGLLPDRGGLFANGNYHFDGTGDFFDDLDYLTQEQGLEGNVFFTGATEQFVWHRQDEDAYFCDVIMASRSTDNDGIELLSDVWQNDRGTLTLEHGIIDVGADSSDWIILNTGFEPDLAMRNNSARGKGVVDLGSRDSYVNGEIDRRVEFGNASGGVITGGYLFPVGQAGEPRADGAVGGRDVDFFRPLILQFPDDLGRSSLAQVNYVGARGEPGDSTAYAKTAVEIRPEDCEFPEGGLVVDAVRSPRGPGGTLTLDVLSNQFWQLEFDRIPSFDPNIRVEADELPNVFEITALRLIQWDCDCTNPRLAGLYDLTGVRDPVDDGSAVLNDFIDGVPNLTQEGVNVNDCNIIGIASNFLINQINIPENPVGFAKVQIIHNSPDSGPIDVYIDGNRVWNDASFQTATPFTPVIGGTHTVEIVAGADADNSNPFFSQTLTVFNDINYVVVAHGLVGDTGDRAFSLVVEDDVRLRSTDDQNVDFFILHGATGLGEVDIRELDAVDNNTVIRLLTNNFGFDDVVRALSLDAGEGHNIEIISADGVNQIDVFRFELQAQRELSVVFALSGSLGKASFDNTTDLTIMGVEPDGEVFFPDLITADEPDPVSELPTTFELFGNYPNPFNPSTSISFDLPQTAEVTIEIIDMLGRSVMTLPAKQMEAGAKRTVEVNASNLASGAYLYRLIARTATETMVKTGRMMLIK